MKDLFKKRPEFVFAGITILFLTILIGYFAWGMRMIMTNLGTAIGSGTRNGQAGAGFDLEGAKRLDLKGLIQ